MARRYYVVWVAYDGHGHWMLRREEIRRRVPLDCLREIERLEDDLRALDQAAHTFPYHTVLNWIPLGGDSDAGEAH
jgi:hypothetical protein